ncbi:MAG: aspartate aminotransferase family protein [Bacteroidota bacterium]|nr:aspartate aminotransferase family protein [Bacteroidota bacterium]
MLISNNIRSNNIETDPSIKTQTDIAQVLEHKHHIQVYNRFPITITRGQGAKVWDSEGKMYIDLLAGIAVNNVGHTHPRVIKAIQNAAISPLHFSNFYYSEPQSQLAKKLAEITGLERVFFCNSGAEAMESCLKLARKWGHSQGKKGSILSLSNSFHGRTLSTLTMSSTKYHNGYAPLPSGFDQARFNQIEDVIKHIDDDTIGIALELIQGNSGVHPVEYAFAQDLNRLCKKNNILLIVDEVQTGVGRTGKMWAYEHFDIQPDMVAIAKALAGGIPIGAMMTSEQVADTFSFGDHGTTFGGNPFACSIALEVLAIIEDEELLKRANKLGSYFMSRFRFLSDKHSCITDVRGLGLMIGVEFDQPTRPIVDKWAELGVLSNAAGGNALRIVPPLTISQELIDVSVEKLDILLEQF